MIIYIYTYIPTYMRGQATRSTTAASLISCRSTRGGSAWSTTIGDCSIGSKRFHA